MPLTKEQLEALIKKDALKLHPITNPTSIGYFLMEGHNYEVWCGCNAVKEERTIHIYAKDTYDVLGEIDSDILFDYHNSPKQKMKRLLDGA